MHGTRLTLLTLSVLLIVTAPPAQAQPIYATIDGIEGSVEIAGREGTVEVLTVEHVLASQGEEGPGPPRFTSGVEHSPLVFGKRLDASTVPLIDALHAGTVIPTIRFSYYTIDDTGTEVEYYRVTLEDAVVTFYEQSYVEDRIEPDERISVVYSAITFTWTDGSLETRYEVETDFSRNAAALADLQVDLNGEAAYVSWVMNAQDGVSGFELQRLTASGYERVAYVPGAGWTEEPRAYEARAVDLGRGLHVFRLAALAVDGQMVYSEEVRVAVGVDDSPLAVGAPYPNPFSSRVTIPVSVDRERDVRVVAYDVLGRTAAVLFDGPVGPGTATPVPFDASALSSGVYVIRAVSEGEAVSKTVRLVR